MFSDDIVFIVEFGVDVNFDVVFFKDGDYGIMSDSDDGIVIFGSWFEVGSVISEIESVVWV